MRPKVITGHIGTRVLRKAGNRICGVGAETHRVYACCCGASAGWTWFEVGTG